MTRASQLAETTACSVPSAPVTPLRHLCYVVAFAATMFAAGCVVGDELPEDQEALDAFEDDSIEAPSELDTIAYSTGNLLTANPGFESKLEYSGWGWFGMVARVQTPHWGYYAVRIADTSTTTNYLESPKIKCWPYVQYVASAYSRWRGGGVSYQPQLLYVRFLDANGRQITWQAWGAPRTSTWSKNQIGFTAPSNCASMTLVAGEFQAGTAARGTYDWDDFRLYER